MHDFNDTLRNKTDKKFKPGMDDKEKVLFNLNDTKMD